MPQFNHELLYGKPNGFRWAQCFPDEPQKQGFGVSPCQGHLYPSQAPGPLPLKKKKALAKNKSANGSSSSQALCGHLKIERIQDLSSFFFFFYNKNKWEMEGE